MSESSSGLQHKINSAGDLKSVVRTMKAMAAANINQYENAVHALDDYYRTVQLGLMAYFRNVGKQVASAHFKHSSTAAKKSKTGIIVIGSDQGLVGQFNDTLVSFMTTNIANMAGDKLIWTVGERIQAHLEDFEYPLQRPVTLPNSIDSVTTLVTDILQEIHLQQQTNQLQEVYLFFNRTLANAQYEPTCQRILPFDNVWQQTILAEPWPTSCRPQLLANTEITFGALIGEYLFTSLYRASIESLASENASRLIAMQRAEKNIEEIQSLLSRQYHRRRQGAIDEELSDLVGGFEALIGVTE